MKFSNPAATGSSEAGFSLATASTLGRRMVTQRYLYCQSGYRCPELFQATSSAAECSNAPSYQTQINNILREVMEREQKTK
jgi:hypothetical protein